MTGKSGTEEVRVRAVAVCGCGHDGRLGLGPASSSSDIITVLPDFLPQAATDTTRDASCCGSHDSTAVLSIHVGGYHTIVCTSDGLYGWGLNECGQLGLGKPATRDEQSVCKPTRLTFFDALYVKCCGHDGTRWQNFVQHVSCGAEHSMVLTSCGLYATGCNQFGQLGLGEDAADTIYEWTLVCASQLTRPRLISDEEPHAEGNVKGDITTSRCMAGDVGRRLLAGAVTAVSCGTHHTLLVCSDVLLRGSLHSGTCDETNNSNNNQASQEMQAVYKCPVLLLACGKGDFGELGYEGDDGAVQRSRDRRQQRSLQAQLLTQAATGASPYENTLAEQQQTTPYLCVPTYKPRVQRRPEFFSGEFRIVQGCDELLMPLCSSANTNDTTVSPHSAQTPCVRELRAMHLHSALTLDMHTDDESCKAETHSTRTYHWGCYYCNAIEDAAASQARLVQPAGWRVHAGNELLLRFAPPETCSASDDLVHVMGSGVLGLGEEDSFEPDWRALQLPVKGESYEVRCVSGRDHILVLLAQRAAAVHSEADSPAQVVLGFGDNLHGQLSRREEGNKHEEEEDDKVVRPVRVLACGDLVRAPHSPQAWQVMHIADAQAGARHSVFLVDLVLHKE